MVFWLNLGCGGGCVKTIKPNQSPGNARPRMQNIVFDGQDHLINALGLPGPGVTSLIEKIKRSPLPNQSCPIGFSVGGHSLQEYQQVIHELAPFIATNFKQSYLELNISCPNTDTGTSMHENLDEIESVLRYSRQLTDAVLVIKVSPDASNDNLCDIASLATSFKNVTLNAGNTQVKTTQQVGLDKSMISIGKGGLSGPSLFNRTLEMAQLLAPFKLPIISTGGISNAEQIELLLSKGVAIVGCATQIVKNPFSIVRMNNELSNRLNG